MHRRALVVGIRLYRLPVMVVNCARRCFSRRLSYACIQYWNQLITELAEGRYGQKAERRKHGDPRQAHRPATAGSPPGTVEDDRFVRTERYPSGATTQRRDPPKGP